MREKKLQKVRLFSVDQQRRNDAWLNDTAPMPAVPATKPRSYTALTEQVCRCIARFVAAHGMVPAAVRVNPCTVFDLPGNRWQTFPFLYEGRIVGIAVIPDQSVPVGDIICEKGQND
jgi:hypothetical protein